MQRRRAGGAGGGTGVKPTNLSSFLDAASTWKPISATQKREMPQDQQTGHHFDSAFLNNFVSQQRLFVFSSD